MEREKKCEKNLMRNAKDLNGKSARTEWALTGKDKNGVFSENFVKSSKYKQIVSKNLIFKDLHKLYIFFNF